jgi:ribosomal protein S9
VLNRFTIFSWKEQLGGGTRGEVGGARKALQRALFERYVRKFSRPRRDVVEEKDEKKESSRQEQKKKTK